MGGDGSGRRGGRPSVERTDSLRLSAKILRGPRLGMYGTATISYDAYGGEFPISLVIDTRNEETPFMELCHDPRNSGSPSASLQSGVYKLSISVPKEQAKHSLTGTPAEHISDLRYRGGTVRRASGSV